MKTITILLLNLFISLSSFSQVINYIEYFFDSDPGLGQATPIEFTSYTQVDQTFTADISTLENGIHKLFVRAKDSTGKWSILGSRLFNVTETIEQTLATQITAIEYFIDTDPGLGNGFPVDLSAGADITIQFDSELNSISNGIHRLFVRAKDNNNNWSILGSRLFNVQSEPEQIASTINSINWTVSGNGITPFSESKIISVPLSELTENISPNISGLTNGDYTLSVTAVDNNGVSSVPNYRTFGVIAPSENKKSAQFDGKGDRIRVTDSAPLNANANTSAYKITGSNITLEAWVYLTELPALNSEYEIIVRPATITNGTDPWFSYALNVQNYDGTPSFNFHLSEGVAGTSFGASAENLTVETGKWYHVAGTYNGTVANIYVDGDLKKSTEFAGKSISEGATGLYIGGFTYGYFKGLIDDVRLWNVTRSQPEISGNLNTTLFGNETGLAGYWQLDSTYVNGSNTITPDLTSNKNDLAVQLDAKLVNFPEGSEVQISPTNISFLLDGISGLPYKSVVISDGWPKSTFTLKSGPDGMILDGDTLKWEIPSSSINTPTVEITANNGGSDLTQSKYLFTENLKTFSNGSDITVTTRGKLGAYVSDSRYTNYGLFYKGKNGLFSGDFSLVDKNDSKYAGGLFSAQKSFRTLTQFESVSGKLNGFSAYQSSMDDAWESEGRINVKVLQTVYTKTEEPDNKYSIIEYKIINTSGAEIDSLYPQFNADFDIGNSVNNLGGYDPDNQLSYGYEGTDPQNTNYYGFSLLNHTVSGAAIIPIGQDPNYFRSTANLSTFTGNSVSAVDTRNQISSGPFTIAADETLTVAFAVLAGDNFDDIQTSAKQAKKSYIQNGRINQNAAYFGLNGDRLSVTAGFPVNESANYSAFQNVGKAITAEAWIYGMSLPKPNSEQIIIGRYLAGGTSPYQTYALRIANYSEDKQPRLQFIISDGTNADWGSATAVVLPSTIGQWFHVAGTYDGTTVKLYINGELAGAGNWNKSIGTNGVGLLIGGGSGFGYANGVADEIKLWNRVKSAEEIKATMNYTSTGKESGLVGYWPMDETYSKNISGQNYKIFPDLSPNHLDMLAYGNVELVDDIAGSEVEIKAKRFRLGDNYVLTGIPFSTNVITDGWPLPSVELQNQKSGITYLQGSNSRLDSIKWETDLSFWGEYYLKASLTNSAGTNTDSAFMYIALNHESNNNKQSLLFTNQGRFGTGGRYGKGLVYNGKNGLYDGTLGIISKTENKVSGGLYGQAEFTDKNPFDINPSPLVGFNPNYESRYTDSGSRNPNPIGVEIRQSVMQKSTSPDDKYSIVEFTVKNKSGKNLPDIYVSLGADFDIGNRLNNLGGYDAANQLSYVYEKDGINNSAYYGFTLLDEIVSGHTLTHSGKIYDDVLALAGVANFDLVPSISQDLRNVLYTGPFNLNNNDSVLVAFAFVVGDNLDDLKQSAEQAKQNYNHSENKNSGAGYFVFTGDRARVNSGAKINPNANDAVLGNFTSNGITVEAWVFPTSLPSPKSEQIIVARPIIAGNPFQTYSLRFANYNQQNYPTLEFIISDGVTPDHWGYAGFTVDNSYIGKWIHVTGTYDGNTVRLFVDGVLKGSSSFDKQIGTNGQGIYIGGGTINGWGRSVIDEVRLWNYAKSGNEISSSMNYTLNGNEPGLVGYWPLDSYSSVQQNGIDISITPDLTENHNDLQMMGFSRIVDDVAGSDVKISPSHLRLTDNYVITGFKYKQGLILDGWPKPEVNLTNPIGNMAINSDSLTWNPNDSFWGEFYLKSTLINSEGQHNDSTFMYVSLAKNAFENTQSLLFSTQGRFSAGGRYGQGLIYNGKNGLFDGAFGVVVKSENVVSGGLNSQAEFTDKLGIQTVTPKINGFDLAYELKYTDQGSRNSKPVGLEITQTVLQKKTAPDDHFTIVEFSIKNKSGKSLQNVFSELAADFDIGDPLNNLGGFIPENNLSYGFEVGGANNSAYYGISLLDEDVSGHTNSLSGFAYNDSEGLLAADSIFAEPTVPKDIRNALFAGPFNLENGDSVFVAYAFVAADNLNELKIAASAAKKAYQPIAVSVAGSRELPKEFSVSQNYPNPFNPSTKISYSVPRSADIQISVFDLMGREIAVLENSRKEVGTYSTIWNSKNISGQTVSSGIYFYRIVAKTEKGVEFVKTNKMLLVK